MENFIFYAVIILSQSVMSLSPSVLIKTYWRRLEDILQTGFADVL